MTGEVEREMLRVMRMILLRIEDLSAQLGKTSEARSSVQINTSARGYDITTKAYEGSPIEGAGDAARNEWLRQRQLIEDALMGKGP